MLCIYSANSISPLILIWWYCMICLTQRAWKLDHYFRSLKFRKVFCSIWNWLILFSIEINVIQHQETAPESIYLDAPTSKYTYSQIKMKNLILRRLLNQSKVNRELTVGFRNFRLLQYSPGHPFEIQDTEFLWLTNTSMHQQMVLIQLCYDRIKWNPD